jgi:hypothetical protein
MICCASLGANAQTVTPGGPMAGTVVVNCNQEAVAHNVCIGQWLVTLRGRRVAFKKGDGIIQSFIVIRMKNIGIVLVMNIRGGMRRG